MIASMILIVIFMMSVVVIHETGHLLAAKHLGLRVDSFSVGMGPKLISKKINRTEYCLRLFPVGGSCEIPDKGINSVTAGEKALVYLAGPAINGITGAIFTALAVIAAKGINGITAIPEMLKTVFLLPYHIARQFVSTSIYDMGGLVKASGETDLAGLMQLNPVAVAFLVMAMFSVILMIFNLIPLPPLDGGEALYAGIEKLFGKNDKLHKAVASVTWAVLITLNVMAVFDDVLYVLKELI